MALQNFFDELRSSRRGLLSFPLGPSASRFRSAGDESGGRPRQAKEDPRVRRSVSSGSIDEFSFEDAFSGGDKGCEHASGDNSSWTFAEGVTRREHQQQQSRQQSQHFNCLLDGLIPLNFFLRTDIVQLVPGENSRAMFPRSTPSHAEEKKQREDGDTSAVVENPLRNQDCAQSERWKVVIGGRVVEPLPHAPHLLAECAYRKGVPVEEMMKVFPPFPMEEEKATEEEEVCDELLQTAGENKHWVSHTSIPTYGLSRPHGVCISAKGRF